jgi:general stress protein 26
MKDLVYQFIKQQSLGVISTVNMANQPESALVGIAVTINFEIIFDTVKTSRKYNNLVNVPNVSLVIGWDNETTIQYEGTAEVLGDDKEAENLKEIYYRSFPDGRERAETWPDLVHIKVTPQWLRYSNFNEPQLIHEMVF